MTEDFFDSLRKRVPLGTRLEPDYHSTGIRASRGESAFFYSIPSKSGKKASQKSIVESEFQKAYIQLQNEGSFTLDWFKTNMPKTASQSTSCSFPVVGESFVLLGLAKRVKQGRGHAYIQAAQLS